MLVDHADAERIGIVRAVDLNFFPILPDGTLFCLIQTKQDAHEGRFAGAVFPQQRMDLSMPQLQGDIIVGDDTRKTLGNMQHFNSIFAVMTVFQLTVLLPLEANFP